MSSLLKRKFFLQLLFDANILDIKQYANDTTFFFKLILFPPFWRNSFLFLSPKKWKKQSVPYQCTTPL